MTAVIVTVAVSAALWFLFRHTGVGLQMRAVVESPRMVELAGDVECTSVLAPVMQWSNAV